MSILSKASILFVDDEPCMREVMAMILNEEGFEVFTAEDGFDALAQMRTSIPDLIISDLHMPRMSGIEFLSVVRRRFPSIPVIAISGAYVMDETFPAGVMADAFYPKGRCHPDELMRTISELLRAPLSRPTNYRPCQPPRVQTARSVPDSSGFPSLLLTCTECLRAFSMMNTAEIGQGIQETRCSFCGTSIHFFSDVPHLAAPSILTPPPEQAGAQAI